MSNLKKFTNNNIQTLNDYKAKKINRLNLKNIFIGKNLEGINLENLVLLGINFTGANLKNANLKNTNLKKLI